MPSPSDVAPILFPVILALGAILLVARVVMLARGAKGAKRQRTRTLPAPAFDRQERQQQCADYRQQLIAAGILQPALDLDAGGVEIASPTG